MNQLKANHFFDDFEEFNFLRSILFDLDLTKFSKNGLDEDRFLELIRFHRVENLFQSKIKDKKLFSLDFEKKLKEICREVQFQELELVEIFFSLVQELNDKKITITSFKGPILSHKLYHDFTKRTYRDCDFAVSIENLDEVISVFQRRGFHLIDSTIDTPLQRENFFKVKNHITFVNERNLIFEIHVTISPFLQNKLLFQNSKYSLVTLQFGKCVVNTLDTVDEFIYLCLHGSRNFFFRMNWVLDLHQYLNLQEEGFLIEVFSRAKEYSCVKFVEESLNVLDLFVGKKYEQTFFTRLMERNQKNQRRFLIKGNKIKLSQKVVLHYQLIYCFFGLKGCFQEFRLRRIKPKNWTFFVFKDSIFGLNQFFSEFIWLFSKMRKNV